MTDWFATGTHHLLAGRLREAIACLDRAVTDAPCHAAHHNLAVALRARGAVADALAHARAASLLSPTSAPTLALAGSLECLAGDHAAGRTTFRRALVVDPAHEVSRYYYAIALAVDGDRASAITELRRLVDDDPRLPVLVRERMRAQLSDLLHGEGPIQRDLCSTQLVTEVLGARERVDDIAPSIRSDRAGRRIDLDEATALLAGARRIVALTGAGISAASGLATRKELWRRYDRDDAVSISRFREDPLPLWTVIREFLGTGAIEPNAAHRALAALPGLAAVVTQNVEGLHRPGPTPCPIIELHGTLLETRCDGCGARPGLSCADVIRCGVIPPPCGCGGVLRPDVVLFGEWVDRERLARAAELCASCDVLLVVGTAADVAPAADLPLLAAARGAIVIEIKRNPSRLVRAIGALHLPGVAEDVLPRLVGAPP